MSRINAVRLVNLNYNNGAIKVSDETTLLSLRNGGGKSVLVQMLLAPFVHPRYRDAKDRPFESYFNSASPTFILVEWVLDQGNGYAMTGMMVRRRQEISEEAENQIGSGELEIWQFISEYQHPCPQDIHQFPIIEKKNGKTSLKNFQACKQLLEQFKKETKSGVRFFYYDMGNAAQARCYYEKLQEYQVNYKEWEAIQKKLNRKESGLSDLFSDCKDEKGLVEKWLLESVESKLNREKSRIREFQEIMLKYAQQYRDNREKIQRRDSIRQFEAGAVEITGLARGYEAAEQEKMLQGMKIGIYLWQLEEARGNAQKEQDGIRADLEALELASARILYQKFSGQVYEAEDRLQYLQGNLEMARLEKAGAESAVQKTVRQLHILELAGRQETLLQTVEEREAFEAKLALVGEEEQASKAERQALGYWLNQHYTGVHNACLDRMTQVEGQLSEVRAKLEEELCVQKRILDERLEKNQALGTLQAKIQGFDQIEDRFNRKYQAGLTRNILGAYEPAALEVCKQEYMAEQDLLQRQIADIRKRLEAGRWSHKELERNLEDCRKTQFQNEAALLEAERVCGELQAELAERKKLLRYFALDDTVLYDREKILAAADQKLLELDGQRRILEKEEDGLQRESFRLLEGIAVDLPEEIAGFFEELGIHYVHGPQWLKKNGFSLEENKRLVEAHPFLPYSLLLPEKDILRLQESDPAPFSNVPIPLLARESLEYAANQEASPDTKVSNRICGAKGGPDDGLQFYILYDQRLLDEAKLEQEINRLQSLAEKKRESIQIRKEESASYYEKRERIRMQKADRKLEEEAENKRSGLAQEQKVLTEQALRLRQDLADLQEWMQGMEKELQEKCREEEKQGERMQDLEEMIRAYAVYQMECDQLDMLKKDLEKLKEKEAVSRALAESAGTQAKKLELQHAKERNLAEKAEQKRAYYAMYKEDPKRPEYLADWEGNPEKVEARHTAITQGFSMKQKELTDLLETAAKKIEKQIREIKRRAKKFDLGKRDWESISYDEAEEDFLEQQLKGQQEDLDWRSMQWREADKQASLAMQELKQCRQRLLEHCGKEEPLEKAEIIQQDYDALLEQNRYRKKQLEERGTAFEKRIGWYGENLTTLSEYEPFRPENKDRFQEFQNQIQHMEEPLETASWEQLRQKTGMLVRDYHACLQQLQEKKEAVVWKLNQLARQDVFAENFFRKPLEVLLSLAEDARQIIPQLETILQSYQNLMEKLAVDISLVEQEQASIVEAFASYIRDVHQNLGMIDQNSTIQVRGRSIKMLKIMLPSWEENEQVYRLRLADYIKETTKDAVSLLEKNENVQEYMGTRVTTRNLYNDVIGIDKVQIRLYKIEEQREYPIPWSQVAKNSGGEGFLSAFVILSSLLHYIRRDETDLFAQRNESKVLVMDNPFAQTNAAHLLKPMMEMAKKTRTQLICLSGLGGESIYNRFDNIYVLNLVAAKLQNGVQYLKGQQVMGKEEMEVQETIEASQVEVVGQETLLF